MLGRRLLIAQLAATSASVEPAGARGRSFAQFLDGVRRDARRLGVSARVLNATLRLETPNLKVLALDHRQPEFTLTWPNYRARLLSNEMVDLARAAYSENRALLASIAERFRVDPRIVVAIWGIESRFGSRTGSIGVVDALATLDFDGRRRAFFHDELLKALLILQQGDVAPAGMTGSYAGAMGQPQFMPSAFLNFAVDYDGDGRRDIWSSRADVLASIANYLERCGWQPGAPWGQPVRLPAEFDVPQRTVEQPLGAWSRLGLRRLDGSRFSRDDVQAALVLADATTGAAFLVYRNFNTIRRYNPSDFYSLAVGLLANSMA